MLNRHFDKFLEGLRDRKKKTNAKNKPERVGDKNSFFSLIKLFFLFVTKTNKQQTRKPVLGDLINRLLKKNFLYESYTYDTRANLIPRVKLFLFV